MQVRTRFAPSPTGDLHLGSVRTALFSYAYANHCGGEFILRIEDTDRERSTEAYTDSILRAMDWLQIPYLGPYYQTKRLDRYREAAEQLLASNQAYRCRCSKERLETLRNQQQAAKQKPRYDGHCRNANHAASNEPYVLRFRNPESNSVIFTDHVRGEISVENAELDDLILIRSDGMPTYNFTVVVDDYDMKITHVIRGDDHINNTPRQINILRALNAHTPEYAHVPMILGKDGKRMSKRDGATNILAYQEQGYLPDALINYLIRLGWAHGDQEIFSRKQIFELFDLTNISSSPATFNLEKLLWLNQHYLKSDPIDAWLPLFIEHLKLPSLDQTQVKQVAAVQVERAKTLAELAEKSRYFFTDDIQYQESAAKKFLKAECLPYLTQTHAALAALNNWQSTPIHDCIQAIVEKNQIGFGQLAQPLRVALTGDTQSPAIDKTIELIGKPKVISRLQKALDYINNSAAPSSPQ